VKISLSSVVQVILYHIGLFFSAAVMMMLMRSSVLQIPVYFVFYLVPLQIFLIRRGREAFIRSIFISFVILILLRLYMASSFAGNIEEMTITRPEFSVLRDVGAVVFPLIMIELVTLASLVGGLAMINLYQDRRWGTLYKLLFATAGATGVGVVMMLILSADSGFVANMEKLFAEIMETIRYFVSEMSGIQGSDTATDPLRGLDTALLMKGFWSYVIGGLAFGYFVNLSITWYVAKIWEARTYGREVVRLVNFYLPDNFVWPFIGSWSLVLLGRFVNLYGIEIVAWNAGLVFLFLFGLQGMGILRHFMRKYNLSRRLHLLIIMGMLIVIFLPPLTIALFVLVPGLGVSEVWIKHRMEKKEKDDE
jgi:hypothetical protein